MEEDGKFTIKTRNPRNPRNPRDWVSLEIVTKMITKYCRIKKNGLLFWRISGPHKLTYNDHYPQSRTLTRKAEDFLKGVSLFWPSERYHPNTTVASVFLFVKRKEQKEKKIFFAKYYIQVAFTPFQKNNWRKKRKNFYLSTIKIQRLRMKNHR